jgi:hypothetical protein
MPLRKESEEAKEKREAGIAKVLEAAGAKTKDGSWRVEWVLKTTVGDLVIIPYEDWIHCRFTDTRAAAEVLRGSPNSHLNTRSGKWNWYGYSPRRTEAADVQIVIDELRRYKLLQDVGGGDRSI